MSNIKIKTISKYNYFKIINFTRYLLFSNKLASIFNFGLFNYIFYYLLLTFYVFNLMYNNSKLI